eukprot:8014584-Pyramimonas_sp.AAC.1
MACNAMHAEILGTMAWGVGYTACPLMQEATAGRHRGVGCVGTAFQAMMRGRRFELIRVKVDHALLRHAH